MLEPEYRLLEKLIDKTRRDQVDWQPTATPLLLAASFGDKYAIRLTRAELGNMILMTVTNAEGEEIAKLTTRDEPRLATLYDAAWRYTRKEADEQLADLMNELDKPSPAETRRKRARLIDEIKRDKK